MVSPLQRSVHLSHDCCLPRFQQSSERLVQGMMISPLQHVQSESAHGFCLGRFQQPSEVDRLDQGMKAAKKAYLKAVHDGGREQGPFLIAKNISIASFQLWIASVESSWKVSLLYKRENERNAYLYGDPTQLHESVAECINDEFVLQVGRLWKSLVKSLGNTTQELLNCMKEPDKSYTSASAISPMPRSTVEVAYRNEDLNKLMKEVQDWHNAGVILALGVKIHAGNMKQGLDRHFAISLHWVKQAQHDKKPEVTDFSPNLCTKHNRGMFRKAFPFSYFTADVSLEKDFLINLDLYELQQHIMLRLHDEAAQNHQMLYVDRSGGYMCGEIATCSVCKVMLRESKLKYGHPDCTSWFHPTCVRFKADAKVPDLWFCAACLKKSEKSSKWTKF